MVELPEGLRSERVAGEVEVDELYRTDVDDMMDKGFARIGKGMRTDTEGTLVGEGDGNDDDGGKDKKEVDE